MDREKLARIEERGDIQEMTFDELCALARALKIRPIDLFYPPPDGAPPGTPSLTREEFERRKAEGRH